MLYEAAIKNVKKATEYIEKKDMKNKGYAIGKVHDIVNELSNTLNHEIGGKIAQDLEALYNFIIRELIAANSKNDIKHLKNIEKLLGTLLEGWKGAAKELAKKKVKQNGIIRTIENKK